MARFHKHHILQEIRAESPVGADLLRLALPVSDCFPEVGGNLLPVAIADVDAETFPFEQRQHFLDEQVGIVGALPFAHQALEFFFGTGGIGQTFADHRFFAVDEFFYFVAYMNRQGPRCQKGRVGMGQIIALVVMPAMFPGEIQLVVIFNIFV